MTDKNLILKFVYSLFFAFLFCAVLFGQEYSYRHYTVKDGLVQNQVINMFQDSKGYLWLGTKGGVSRFDGMEFENYTMNDGLLSNHVVNIFEDSEGGIYLCSYYGISKIFNGMVQTVLLNDTIDSNRGYAIIPHFTKTEMCILNTTNLPGYFGEYDSSFVSQIMKLDKGYLGSIFKEKDCSKYWIRTQDNKLYCISNDSIVLFANDFFGRIGQDGFGEVFLYDQYNIFKIDTLSGLSNLSFSIPADGAYVLYDFDKDNNAHFGYNQKYIVVWEGNKITQFKKKFNYINKILIDSEDILWIATETGFYKRINNAFENFTTETGSNEYVWSLVEDNDKNIWFASYGDGLSMWDGQKINRITDYLSVYSKLQGKYFYTGAELARNNNIYFPVREKGILRYDGTQFSLVNGLPRGSVLDVFDDTLNNRLLAASTAGLIVLENYITPVLYQRDYLDTKKYLKTIAMDKYGRYWLGGEYMLNVFDGKDFIEFPNKEFDYSSGAIAIYMDYMKNLWLGTPAGLYFFDYKKFTRIGPDILKGHVASFTELDSNKLVMGVSQGMAKLDLEKFYSGTDTSIIVLDYARGFLGFDCVRNGILKDSDDNIWVAASDRVVKLYPDRLKRDTIKPRIVIQQFNATGSDNEQGINLGMNIFSDTLIELPHYLKNIRFDFHAIHFNAPEKVVYSYILSGYDNNWSSISIERYASYTNLPPGKYTFKVNAQNLDGLQSENPAVVSFEIVPAFWQTFTFRMIANILILILSLFIGYIILTYRRRRRQKTEDTEKQISELQLKTIRSQMDPHFTFNALNSISSVIYKENKEKAYRYFTKFSKLIRSSLEVSDQISRSLEEEVDFTENYLELEKIRFKENFIYQISIDSSVDQQMLVPKMIIQNYVENAIKHGLKHLEKNRKLEISIQRLSDHVEIIVQDNGIGRNLASQQKEISTGKGLDIMNSIYDLYFKLYKVRIKQEIEDLYNPDGEPAGTKVILTIPISVRKLK